MDNFDFLAAYVVDVVEDDLEILDVNSFALKGDLNNESYFHECATELYKSDLAGLIISSQFGSLPEGTHRVVLGVNCFSEGPNHEGEYDAWETYKVLHFVNYDEEQANFLKESFFDIPLIDNIH